MAQELDSVYGNFGTMTTAAKHLDLEDENRTLRRQILELQIHNLDLLLKERSESDLRAIHPGLKELWDAYQTMLVLVSKKP